MFSEVTLQSTVNKSETDRNARRLKDGKKIRTLT